RNSAVLARSWSSERTLISGSSALMSATMGSIFLTSRSCFEPKIVVNTLSIMMVFSQQQTNRRSGRGSAGRGGRAGGGGAGEGGESEGAPAARRLVSARLAGALIRGDDDFRRTLRKKIFHAPPARPDPSTSSG